MCNLEAENVTVLRTPEGWIAAHRVWAGDSWKVSFVDEVTESRVKAVTKATEVARSRGLELRFDTRTTVGHVYDDRVGVYIGRPRKGEPWQWGNPFSVGEEGTREEVIEKFSKWLAISSDPRAEWMRENIEQLRGRHLKCFCRWPEYGRNLACHGDVFVAWLHAGEPS